MRRFSLPDRRKGLSVDGSGFILGGEETAGINAALPVLAHSIDMLLTGQMRPVARIADAPILSAIGKRPREGALWLSCNGLEGDEQGDQIYHGGPDKVLHPKWQGNFTLRYSVPLGNGDFFAYTDWAYRTTYNMFLYEAKEYKAKSLLEGGLRIGYKWGDGKYEAAAFARNITDREQLIGAIHFNNLTGIVNEPRTFGAQFKVNF